MVEGETSGLTKCSGFYAAVSVIWLLCLQTVLSVMLFRKELCVDCIDDEGLVGIDRFLVSTFPWLLYAFYALAICGLLILCASVTAWLAGRAAGSAQSIAMVACAGLGCPAVAYLSVFWLSSDHLLSVGLSAGHIAGACLFDVMLVSLLLKFHRRVRRDRIAETLS